MAKKKSNLTRLSTDALQKEIERREKQVGQEDRRDEGRQEGREREDLFPQEDPLAFRSWIGALERISEGLQHPSHGRCHPILVMGYPSRAKELEILDTHGITSTYTDLQPVVTSTDVLRMVGIARQIYVSEPIKEYLVDTVEATRVDPNLLLGASPRATLYLQRSSRTRAAMDGRNYVTPDDVKAMLRPVLTHRLILRPEAQMRGITLEDIVEGIATGVEVPGTRVRG